MNEIYWMTRLDSLKTLLGFIIAITVVFAIIGVTIMIATYSRDYESEKKAFKIGKQLTTILGSIALTFGIINCFIPSTQDAYMIYGVGGTIDYVKSNETAKQLPDKCLQALDKYLTDEIKK